MARPNAYSDVLFPHDLSYVYGISVRLIVDYVNEPIEFYLGPAKPSHSITVIFREGGMHYSATRPIIRAELPIVQKKKRDNNFHGNDPKQKKSKQNKETTIFMKMTQSSRNLNKIKGQRQKASRQKKY